MNDEQQNDEELIERLMRPLDNDAAPVEIETIFRIGEQAGDVFAEFGEQRLGAATESPTDVVNVSTQQRRRSMITKAVLGFSAVAAALALLLQPPGGTDQRDTLGTVLNKTLEAKNLKLTVDRDGNQSEVLVSGATLVRWQDSPTKYRIASAAQMYEVDEQQNKVRKFDSPWHLPDSQQLDLLSLLGIEIKQSQDLRQLVASKVETVDQKERHVFTSAVSDAVVHVWLDKSTGGFSELRCWPRGFNPNVPPIKLFVVARDIRVDESKFIVADTLSQDGRIGKVVDAQGVVTLRPMMNQRWTPVGRQMLLKPGDWVRTDARGANATTLILTSLYKIVVGPATLLEIRSPTELKVHRGELKVVGAKIASEDLKLLGPRTALESVSKGQTVHLRVDQEDGGFTKVSNKPMWLAGFEGSSNVDPVGSLLANIDGRNTPLTIGVHKVKVEIRDQIARTTIEESFINHTSRRLEGIFHFPLPQDASISGFGMWIDGELVEADVVEKQRAREIYETILRERRDPGLLEWTGGNIFKARVFPIEPTREKRIKIVYTQVLPLRANKYRYSYGLRSEMLQKTPVRELSLDVQIYSALPLRSIECPTHSVRTQQTKHAAKLEFEAQEYTPKRDFEVVCEVDSSGRDVVVIPHQRGDDGYFLVQLTPPGTQGNWQRELVADGDPLQVLLVCDTSASMDSTMRNNQQQFVSSILSGLGEDDRFDIAYCDVDCGWLHDEVVSPTDQNAGEAAQWLSDRISLGWTNLDVMMESVLPRAGDKTHVVYIGDGIVTSGDADPQTFVNRLRQLTAQKRAGTFHAVSVGSSFESVVLKSVAAIGGGSVRKVDGEQTPQRVAFELLNEISQPGLRDLKVQFRGLQVAAVYPDRLPNLAAGTQQVLIGRYLPEGENQSGEIIVTGKRGDETVRYTTTIAVADAQSGNSFLPRLWARGHLDHLLSQGASQLIRDQIVRLAEEFHIITPYTSLLVLESDADRERFGVKRRFEMRDGERFFADGRDNANFELLQQQMKRAGDWRLALRRRMLAEVMTLGRDANVYQSLPAHTLSPMAMDSSGSIWVTGGVMMRAEASTRSTTYSSNEFGSWGGMGGGGYGGGSGLDLSDFTIAGDDAVGDMNGPQAIDAADKVFEMEALRSLDGDFEMNANIADFGQHQDQQLAGGFGLALPSSAARQKGDKQLGLAGMKANRPLGIVLNGQPSSHWGQRYSHDPYGSYGQYTSWVNQLFPTIPSPPLKWTPQQPAAEADAVRLLESLIQQVKLTDEAGVEVNQTTQSFDPIWDRLTSVTNSVDLSAANRWLKFTRSAAANTHVHWCDAQQRGVYSQAFLLGRTRKATAEDLSDYQPGTRPMATAAELSAYTQYTATVLEIGDRESTVTLTHKDNDRVRAQITIDTNRNVVTSIQHWNQWEDEQSKPDHTTKYSQYKQVAGVWWPGKVETLNKDGERTSLVAQKVKLLLADQFGKRFASEMPDREQVLVLAPPLPTVRESHIAVRDGSADARHRLTLILDAAVYQDWDAALKHLLALEKLESGKPCLPWIRVSVLRIARKNNDLLLQLRALSDKLAGGDIDDELFLSDHVLNESAYVADHNEQLRLLDRVAAVFQRQPDHVRGPARLQAHRAASLRSLGRPQAIEFQRELAVDAPWDFQAQLLYAHDLVNAGDHDAAIAWLEKQIADYPGDAQVNLDSLRNRITSVLRELGRADELVDYLQQWLAADPESAAVHRQYLSALMMANRIDDADEIAARWMKEGQVEGKLDPAVHRRLTSGISYALGHRYQTHMNWTQPKWRKPLAETALFFLESEHHRDIPRQIIGQSNFVNTDQSDALRIEIAQRLRASVAKFDAQRVQTFVGWTVNRNFLTRQQWKKIARTIKKRWTDEQDHADRNQFAVALNSIYGTHFIDSDQLPFMRERITRAEADQEFPQDASAFRRELFNVLVARPWQQEHEDEAFALVTGLGQMHDDHSPLPDQLRGLMELVDKMLASRQAAAKQSLEANQGPEELTRTEYAAKLAEFLQAARQGVAASLARHEDLDNELGHWIRLERMHLDVQLGRKLNQIAADCWKTLGQEPQAEEDLAIESVTHGQRVTFLSESLRRDRTLTVIYYLALRRGAPQSLVDRLMKYVAAGTKLPSDSGAQWRQRRYALLIGLDQPELLGRELNEWIRDDAWPIDWQRRLARLEAERGKIDTAIGLIESAGKLTRLTSEDYAALAPWYLVSDQREAYERSKIAVYESMPEHIISSWLNGRLNHWWNNSQPLPTELDENVLFALRALFAKSNQPENYVHSLKRFYEASGDFRLLQMLPDSVIGRTPQQIYPMLDQLSTQLMPTIRKEATADEIVRRISALRDDDDSPFDERALDLLETMIERQSAKVINEPGPHIERALAAMKRAFKHDWADGEVRQMASFLASMSTLTRADLRAERLRQFRALIAMTEPETEDRFFVSWHTAHAIAWSHGDHDQGIAEMEIAIRDYRQLYSKGFPATSNQAIFDYVRMLGYRGRFAEAERFLNHEIDNSINQAQRLAYTQQRNNTYIHALRDRGQVDLGVGNELYRNLQEHFLDQADVAVTDNARKAAIDSLLKFYQTASDKSFADAKDDFWTFVSLRLGPVLQRQTADYESIVRSTMDKTVKLLGTFKALEFLIQRLEEYPARLDYDWNTPWRRFGYKIAEWRRAHGANLGKLEPRLMSLLLDELRRDLRSRHSRSRYMYGSYSNYFWTEKAGTFARVANEIYDEDPDSARATTYIARYFANDLGRYGRAIEIMMTAYKKESLTWDQQNHLVDFLHHEKLFAESIPILEPLVQSRPDDIHHRTELLTAYQGTKQFKKWDRLLADTDKHFRKEGRWTEGAVQALASVCLDNAYHAEAAAYYSAVISIHKRTDRRRQYRDYYTLSGYYAQQALAYSGLDDTQQAVDAASAAIVTYGRNVSERRSMNYRLKSVLDAAKDLDAYVKKLDQQSEQTGQDNPTLRKMIGMVYADRNAHDKAIKQLRLALAMQPNDVETHQKLIKELDATKDSAGAIRQTLALLDVDRHNLEHYKKLAQRLKDDQAMSERALTTIVEAAPSESEHHQALAELRQTQNRWAEAIDHWKHVAKLRRLEPNGLLKLAQAQIKAEQKDAARETLRKVTQTEWPPRFTDVQQQVDQLMQNVAP